MKGDVNMIDLIGNVSVECYYMQETVNGVRYGVITSNNENGEIRFTTDCIRIEKTYRTIKGMARYLIERDWYPCNSNHMEICKNQIHHIK